jgi:amino acid adenylation domain-containing protein
MQDRTPTSARESRSRAAPVTFVQQRLWLFEQLEPGNVVYQRPFRLWLRGRLRPEVLERALTEIVRRHESLRTVFAEEGGIPVPVVRPSEPQRLPIEDLRGLPESEREARIEERDAEEASRSFDLARGPLFRARLFRRSDEDHLLLWNIHHIVFDAWSMTILRHELEALYAAFEAGEPSPLPDPMPYSDFARRQRGLLQDESIHEQLAYWKKALAGAPDLLDLPFDRPRPARQRYRGATEDFAFDRGTAGALGTLARETGATLFMSVLAAFQVLLSRYAGREDFLVGVPIAGRRKAESEDVIGCFINTLLLRADLSGKPGFREVLSRVRTAALGAFEHQDVPFEKVAEALAPRRGLNHSPLFQVMLNFHNVPQPREIGGPLAVELEERPSRVAMVDLTLQFWPRPAGLDARFIYDRDLFDAPTVRRMSEHLRALVASALENPDRPVNELPLMTERERNGMLAAWNRPRCPLPPRATVGDLIARQIARRPGSIALEGAGQTLTYAELGGRVERLAGRLRHAGLGPERVAALFGPRSLDTIVGMLAIIESGGAFLPLDSSLPRNRLDFLLGDARPDLVAAPRVLAQPFVKRDLTFVPIDDEQPGASLAQRVDRARLDADRLAYLIYTSGSAGQAKGVEVSHRSLLNFTLWARREFRLRPEDRVLQMGPLHFDTAFEEIFPALAAGATLVLRPDSAIESPAAFLDWCRVARLTVLDLPTAYWHEVAAALGRAETKVPEEVRLVVIGGEAALPERLERWRRTVGPRVRLLNTYGPTEATVAATMADLTPTDARSQPEAAVPIGHPIRNVRAYVLDGGHQPAPIGVPGELYLAGAGIARGYRNDREGTARSFTADPFDREPGARRYATGDRARYLGDGTLEFLGRLDGQVKIRGFRVDPIEIERCLAQHPGLAEAAVVASENAPGDRRLIAYWVAAPGAAPSARQLQEFLAGRLSDYMVPRSFVRLERLPRGSTGKVDRRTLQRSRTSRVGIHRLRLPATETASAAPTESLAPRTPVEQILAGIWKEILKVDRVDSRDDFFELGGHSLLATQLVSRVAESFGLWIPIRRVFEEPILERLALAITHDLAESGEGAEMGRPLGEVRGPSGQEARRHDVP